MKLTLTLFLIFFVLPGFAQPTVDLSALRDNGAQVAVNKNEITLEWPSGAGKVSIMRLNLVPGQPLITSLRTGSKTAAPEIATDLDPVFILRVGQRKLDPASGGWDIFFDKVHQKPYTTEVIGLDKKHASVHTEGSATVVKIDRLQASGFSGQLEITCYNGSPLFNIAAVISTAKDSTAILYDAGLVNKKASWQNIAWSNVRNQIERTRPTEETQSIAKEVKYRTIIGEGTSGSLALFPAPHQYFYPLDEAFNLRFTWYGKNYLDLVPEFGIGIRQEPTGDHRYIPWFNAPPHTQQRLNFFCWLSDQNATVALSEVKKLTHNDRFKPLKGFKTMASHFHNEFIMNEVLSGRPVPEHPEFVSVLKNAGLDIVKLAEFHGPGHPRGPDSLRLRELKALFEQTRRLSTPDFLLLPGEEANNFYGGHWLAFFPKPVYWVMSRKPGMPFEANDPVYGKVYRVSNKEEMLQLLEKEKGLAWVAHARTKGSTGYPDAYKNEAFFKSDTYFGAAWKAIPADLSWPNLSRRVLHLMDDMANWGHRKYAIAESDIFTITEQNEMYAHLNVTYLQLNEIPRYDQGWSSVLNAMKQGKFFVSTGEVLIPSFSISGKSSGQTLSQPADGKAVIEADLEWTFPLRFAEIVSGDGHQVYRETINLNTTTAFGKKHFEWPVDLKGKKWIRIEAWDVAANGAFTPMIWIE